jgi:hypothetical protein
MVKSILCLNKGFEFFENKEKLIVPEIILSCSVTIGKTDPLKDFYNGIVLEEPG